MRAGCLVIKYGDKQIRLVPSLLKESDVRRYKEWFDKVHHMKKEKRENPKAHRIATMKKKEA